MNISILFTIIFIIFYLVLTIITIRARKSARVEYGDGFNKELTKAIRAHGNFFEFTVFFVISSFLLELLEGNQIYIFIVNLDRKSTRLNSSHSQQSRMPSSA